MPELHSIIALIDSAKRLRNLAEELGSVELKSRIVDEIMLLQELREQIFEAEHPEAETVNTTAEGTVHQLGQPSEFARIEPSQDLEGYSFALAEEDAEPASDEQGNESDTSTDLRAEETAQIPIQSSDATEMSDAERFDLTKQRLIELEPLHQDCLRKMNEILNEEQKAAKKAATKAGRKAGLKGKELQRAVMDAIGLSESQAQEMATARRELHDVRVAMANQVEGLISKEELEQMLKDLG